jgi:hypothetical protein
VLFNNKKQRAYSMKYLSKIIKQLLIMDVKKSTHFALYLLLLPLWSLAQNFDGPRLFLDVPAIYATAPSIKNVSNNAGLAGEILMNVATHHIVGRAGGGFIYSFDPQAKDFFTSTLSTPYVLLEFGAGNYRSNGNKCARTHRPAFTAIAKAGIMHQFLVGRNRPTDSPAGNFDYTVGLEFGYFYIRDIFRNSEVFVRSNYFIKSEAISLDLGLKIFLNLKADRD